MKNAITFFLTLIINLLIFNIKTNAQGLAILAFDEVNQVMGVVMAGNELAISQKGLEIDLEKGIVVQTQSIHPTYQKNHSKLKNIKNIEGFEMMLIQNKLKDPHHYFRQVAFMNPQGLGFVYSGNSVYHTKNFTGSIIGKNIIVLGNGLKNELVLDTIAKTFLNSKGKMGEKLMNALTIGQTIDGWENDKQSATIVVKSKSKKDDLDLTIDFSEKAIFDLKKLVDFHYGKQKLYLANRYVYEKNIPKANKYLKEAEQLFDGNTELYNQLIFFHLKLKNQEKAIQLIQKAINNNPSWKKHLPRYHILKDFPVYNQLLDESKEFSLSDWISATRLYISLGENEKAKNLLEEIILDFPESSYLYLLLGKAHLGLNDKVSAGQHFQKAIQLDPQNIEAKAALNKL